MEEARLESFLAGVDEIIGEGYCKGGRAREARGGIRQGQWTTLGLVLFLTLAPGLGPGRGKPKGA